MTTIHDDVRAALLDDERPPRVERHLRRCPDCTAFDDRLRRVLREAGHVTAAPEGLADRVLQRLSGSQTVTPLPARPSPLGRSLRRSAALAAAVLVLVAAVAVLRGDSGDGGREVLLAAATRTAEAGPAAVQVEGEAEVVVETPDPGADPDLSGVPPELHAYVEAQFALVLEEWERQMAAFQAQLDATLEEANRQLERAFEDAFEGAFGGGPGGGPGQRPGTPPPPPAPPAPPHPPEHQEPQDPAERPERPERPERVSARIDVDAHGTVAVGRALRLDGGVRVGAGAAPFTLVATGADAAVQAGGTWAAVPDVAGPLGTVLASADGLTRVLRNPAGRVERVGPAEVAGEHVIRYRFPVDGRTLDAGAALGGRWTAEADIDDEGRLRRLRLRSDGNLAAGGAGGADAWRADVAVTLSAFGQAPPDVRRPQTTAASTAAAPAALLYHPLGAAVAAAARG